METIVLRDRVTASMSDEEFLWFCLENKDLRIERNSNLEITIMSPVTTRSNYGSGAVFAQLYVWSLSNEMGYAFDSSTGFTLPDRSVFSPDASWVSKKKWNKLTEEDQDRFAPVCPEFVIELCSKSDSLEALKTKMNIWINNGAELGWLIDPRSEISFIYRPDMPEEKTEGLNKSLIGEGPVAGFELDLSKIKI